MLFHVRANYEKFCAVFSKMFWGYMFQIFESAEKICMRKFVDPTAYQKQFILEQCEIRVRI